jgi:hypothetical protein
VFDRDDVTSRLTSQLQLLLAIDVPAPDAVAPVVGVDPVGLLRQGTAHDLKSMSVTFSPNLPDAVRLDGDESVEFHALHVEPASVADELTARLAATLRFR